MDLNAMYVFQDTRISKWADSKEKKNKKGFRSKSHIPSSRREQVWRMENGDTFDGRCSLCHEELAFRDCHISHKIARAKGGSDEIQNLCCLHAGCNRDVGTGSVLEYKRKYYSHLI